jgi:hypothetical protein
VHYFLTIDFLLTVTANCIENVFVFYEDSIFKILFTAFAKSYL